MHSHSPGAHRNRLAGETSPYLLQHAGNPVDWYPWGPEALERAGATATGETANSKVMLDPRSLHEWYA